MNKEIIFDCDNTFGIPECDIDDGLALIYLLGCGEADLKAVTSTYGNNQTDVVYENTKHMLKDLGRSDIPLIKGGKYPRDIDSEASCYLAEMAQQYKGRLTILATGSLTNLYGAWVRDENFFHNIKEIILMGGITEPLIFAKREMDELNFSCDPKASACVLEKGKNVSVITGNNCLKVLFTREAYEKGLCQTGNSVVQCIKAKTEGWFSYNQSVYGIDGYYNWDVIAAAYAIHPELFYGKQHSLRISESGLAHGYLQQEPDGTGNIQLNLPEIREPDLFQEHIYQTWTKAER